MTLIINGERQREVYARKHVNEDGTSIGDDAAVNVSSRIILKKHKRINKIEYKPKE